MPTGYTAGVGDGKVESFSEFAMECARAFGALVELRDEPTAPIPDAFTADTYHAKELVKTRKELRELDSVTDEDAQRLSDESYEQAMAAWTEGKKRREQVRLRYEAMLEQVKAWTPPTSDHNELKKFMVQQLTESILFDCDHDDERWMPKRRTAKQWRADRLKTLLRDVEYHKEGAENDFKRAADRTKWIRDLRDSLHQPEPTTR